MAGGYIKLYRSLLDNSIFSNEKLLKVWIWCLLKASHQPKEVTIGLQKLRLEAGQFYTGRNNAGQELGLKPSTAWRYILGLKSLEKVDIKSNNKFSVVTVVNWDFYQSEKGERGQQNKHQMDIKWTSNEHQMDTNKNVKKDKNINKAIGDNAVFDRLIELYKHHHPQAVKRFKVGGIVKARQIFEEAIQNGTDQELLAQAIVDNPEMPPWDIVKAMSPPKQLTEDELRHQQWLKECQQDGFYVDD